MNDYKLFVEKYDTAIKKFAFFSKMKDSEQFLIENTHLGKVKPSLCIMWCEIENKGVLLAVSMKLFQFVCPADMVRWSSAALARAHIPDCTNISCRY